MPPKVKVTKEDIINAAVNIVRTGGAQAINARTFASVLNCSTQLATGFFDINWELVSKMLTFANRNTKEILRDPLNLFF